MFRCSFFVLCGWAAVMPLLEPAPPGASRSAPAWPAAFENKPIWRVPLSPGEERFNRDFPGAVARFTDGERQFILRWATRGTRKLHSSADCFRGLGYRIDPEPPWLDENGLRWGCFAAQRGTHRLVIRERIADPATGQAWSDVSAWYWSALLRQSRGPWLAITVVGEASAGGSRQ